MNTDRFDSFVQHVIDGCCNDCGSMTTDEFARVCAIVSRREAPRNVRPALARLGYIVHGRLITGLSPRSAEFYVKTNVGECVAIDDVLATVPHGYARRWAEYVLTSMPHVAGILEHATLH